MGKSRRMLLAGFCLVLLSATSAAMPGPGEAAATSKVPAKRASAAGSISDILETDETAM